jgi:FkbM family methyltransferase
VQLASFGHSLWTLPTFERAGALDPVTGLKTKVSAKLSIGERKVDSMEKISNHATIVFEDKSYFFSHSDEKDHIYSIIKNRGEFYEQELLSALRPLLSPGDWVVDVGANIGCHSVYFAGVCGCNVIAFEPNPVAANILRKNIELNGLENQVQVHQIALGSHAGTGSIVSPDDHNLGMAEVLRADGDTGTVQIGLMSDYIGSNRIRLIKIDAEGMDLEVLRGSVSVIERDRSAVTIEASSRDSFLKISGMLEPYGYTSAGSFNYTPTHLFVEDDGTQAHRTLQLISRQIAVDYIDHAALRDALNRGLSQTRTQRDQLSGTLSDYFKDLLAGLTRHEKAITGELREYVRSEIAASGKQTADQISSEIVALGTRLTSIETAAEAVLQLSRAAERSNDRLDAIEHAIARLDQKQDFADDRNARVASAITGKVADLRRNIESMAQFAALWAEIEHLQAAAQSQTKAQRESELMKQAEAGTTPADKGSVWRVVREGPGPAPARLVSSGLKEKPKPVVIADEAFSGTWDGIGWAIGNAELDPGGIVRATGGGGAGFVTQTYPFPDGGLLEIEIETASEATGSVRPVLSIVSDGDESIGPETTLRSGTTTVRAFAPGRTRGVKLRIHARNAGTGNSFAVRRLIIRRISLDAHQRDVCGRIGEPVLASMASIPSRRTMLADAVNSLLAQCDRVRVFLNNYPDIPEFLLHPRVDVRRSQDWDDRGDAGKMFWLEHDRQAGYRLIVDDDLIFPPDFADVMCGKVGAKGKRAIYATHGVLLRQPVINYYDDRSRAATFHFGSELSNDRRVHIGATNALCMHSSAVSMRWNDFKYCNSADVWLALHAQQNNLQVLTPQRRANWVRENRHAAPEETIYRHSLNRTRTRFDSSLVQDAVLKHNWPLTIKVGDGHKYGVLLALDSIDGLGAGLERFLDRAASETAEWVVLLAFDRSDAALEEAVAGLRIERETHLIDTAKTDALTQANALMARTGIEALLALEAQSLADQMGGEPLTADEAEAWGASHLLKLKAGKRLAGAVVARGKDEAARLLALCGGLRLKPSGGRSAFTRSPTTQPLPAPAVDATASGPTIHSVFERVRVLNLDRRADRWESVSRSLALAGIKAERFSAVDGSRPDVAAEYEAYLQQPPVTVSDAVPPINSQRDFYLDYPSHMARIAHLERAGKKAIASSGAWGYLKSSEIILEEALADNTGSLMLLEDDVALHKDIRALFAEAMRQLPDNWLILQLGTLQYNWTPPWAEWHSPLLYRTNGSAIGSHAVGMRFDVIPFLLDQVKRFDMPYDIGPLSAATRAFPDRCFVIHPNLAIQTLADSDIGTSEYLKQKNREEAAATYRWNLEDYQ